MPYSVISLYSISIRVLSRSRLDLFYGSKSTGSSTLSGAADDVMPSAWSSCVPYQALIGSMVEVRIEIVLYPCLIEDLDDTNKIDKLVYLVSIVYRVRNPVSSLDFRTEYPY